MFSAAAPRLQARTAHGRSADVDQDDENRFQQFRWTTSRFGAIISGGQRQQQIRRT